MLVLKLGWVLIRTILQNTCWSMAQFCTCISCGKHEDTLCTAKSNKFPSRTDSVAVLARNHLVGLSTDLARRNSLKSSQASLKHFASKTSSLLKFKLSKFSSRNFTKWTLTSLFWNSFRDSLRFSSRCFSRITYFFRNSLRKFYNMLSATLPGMFTGILLRFFRDINFWRAYEI